VTVYADGAMAQHNDTLGKVCPMSGRLAFFWDEASTREAVKGRSGGICEYCHHHRAAEMHHRKSRGVGGDWSPANILHLCSRCHRYFTDHPQDGYQLGVCLRRHEEPADVPVTMYDGLTMWVSDNVAPPSSGHRARSERRRK
jgi:hypothetical protein